MAKKETEKEKVKGVFTTLHNAVDSVKTSVKNVKLPDVNTPEIKVPDQVKELFKLKPHKDTRDDTDELFEVKAISTKNAIKIIYYLMAADGEIFHSEEEKFDAIGAELDPDFSGNKEQIVKECKTQMDKVIDPEDYCDVLQEGIELALSSSSRTEAAFITPKLLVWDLLTIAYSDGNYDMSERRLLKYVVRKLNIDKAIFLEMESSILTLIDLERELKWIKSTDRPYLTVETMVNEIADRKNVIFESVKDLIAL